MFPSGPTLDKGGIAISELWEKFCQYTSAVERLIQVSETSTEIMRTAVKKFSEGITLTGEAMQESRDMRRSHEDLIQKFQGVNEMHSADIKELIKAFKEVADGLRAAD